MRKIVNILMVIVFFNISFFNLYYLKVIDNMGIVIFNNYYDYLMTNVFLLFILIIYSYFYSKYLIGKFNYFKCALLGIFIAIPGVAVIPVFSFQERLFYILFSSFAITYISYSLYFENIKKNVFK